jgi:ADP-heptose:LPS heptosyltransferase
MDFPVSLQPEDVCHINSLLADLPQSKYLLGIVAGGGRNPGQVVEAKNWSSEGYSNVIGKLLENHDVTILFFGKDEDALIAGDILNCVQIKHPDTRVERVANLCDKTTIRQAAALLKKCHVVLTNDTSLMHLAAAVGTPTVSIFGPTDPANLAPRGSMHHVVVSGLACSPCYERQGYMACRSECMESITWEQVYDKVVAVLNERSLESSL